MECVAGKTLDALIPRQGMRLTDALIVAIQMANALKRCPGQPSPESGTRGSGQPSPYDPKASTQIEWEPTPFQSRVRA